MDAERYARVRELFLAVEELPADQQREFLNAQCGDDHDLQQEVLSLLSEHDVENARLEGESAKKPAIPSVNAPADSSSQQAEQTTGASLDSAAGIAAPFLPGAPGSSSSRTVAAENSLEESKRRRDEIRKVEKRTKPMAESVQVTQHSSQRTHATPRYSSDRSGKRRERPVAGIWQNKVRRHRRFNSGWLFVAAMLPTVLVGVWTYNRVISDLRQASANELAGVADSVQISVQQFLDDQARLVSSWSRQPDLRRSVLALIETSAGDASADTLRQSPDAQQIRAQLIALSEREDVKYVVWDRTGKIIASWLKDGTDVGGYVAPDGAANLAKAMRGEECSVRPRTSDCRQERICPGNQSSRDGRDRSHRRRKRKHCCDDAGSWNWTIRCL